MLYTTLEKLQAVLAAHLILKLCDDNGAGVWDAAATANLEAANSAAVADIHLRCREHYALPFDPVPDEIEYLTSQLMKCHLYYRRMTDEVPESVDSLYARLLKTIDGITSNTFRMDAQSSEVKGFGLSAVSDSVRRFGGGFMGELMDE